jgi:peptidoglycan hydrolase-like protein with peptidoglycan-binding domain
MTEVGSRPPAESRLAAQSGRERLAALAVGILLFVGVLIPLSGQKSKEKTTTVRVIDLSSLSVNEVRDALSSAIAAPQGTAVLITGSAADIEAVVALLPEASTSNRPPTTSEAPAETDGTIEVGTITTTATTTAPPSSATSSNTPPGATTSSVPATSSSSTPASSTALPATSSSASTEASPPTTATPPTIDPERMPRLAIGSEEAAVEVLTSALRYLGYNVDLSAKFTQQVADAVRQFQSSAQITADGIVGRQTWSALATAVAEGSEPPPSTANAVGFGLIRTSRGATQAAVPDEGAPPTTPILPATTGAPAVSGNHPIYVLVRDHNPCEVFDATIVDEYGQVLWSCAHRDEDGTTVADAAVAFFVALTPLLGVEVAQRRRRPPVHSNVKTVGDPDTAGPGATVGPAAGASSLESEPPQMIRKKVALAVPSSTALALPAVASAETAIRGFGYVRIADVLYPVIPASESVPVFPGESVTVLEHDPSKEQHP